MGTFKTIVLDHLDVATALKDHFTHLLKTAEKDPSLKQTPQNFLYQISEKLPGQHLTWQEITPEQMGEISLGRPEPQQSMIQVD